MEKGDRVESNGKYALTHWLAIKRNRGRDLTGQVVGYSRTNNCVRVKWDHLTSTFTINRNFLRKTS